MKKIKTWRAATTRRVEERAKLNIIEGGKERIRRGIRESKKIKSKKKQKSAFDFFSFSFCLSSPTHTHKNVILFFYFVLHCNPE